MKVEGHWRQFEAVSAVYRDQFERELAAIGFPAEPHGENGFQPGRFAMGLTRLRVSAPLAEPLPWSEVLEAFFVGEDQIDGLWVRDSPWRVRGGFSFRVGRMGVYGIREPKGVTILGF